MEHAETVTAVDYKGSGGKVVLRGMPDRCPRCHRHIGPNFRSAIQKQKEVVRAVYQCTSAECQEPFFALFEWTGHAEAGGGYIYKFWGTYPKAPQPAQFPAEIARVSPNFVLIYNQAVAAEAAGLDQVVGIALRKALEFLIKDFCISESPGSEAAIKSCLLGPCIDNYVSDSMIKQVAKRAVWLGNDETHYVRKWIAKDVEDLKTLVKLTVNWIDSSLTTKKYLAEMAGQGGSAPPPSP